jgi:hypothetical protein
MYGNIDIKAMGSQIRHNAVHIDQLGDQVGEYNAKDACDLPRMNSCFVGKGVDNRRRECKGCDSDIFVKGMIEV